MAQNIYDNEVFFVGYARLPRSVQGLDGAPEWPALRALLPDLSGRKVLDLGCGYGWFCRWARQAGAAEVVGIDVSEKMLARARADTRDTAIHYRQADMASLDLPPETFGLVYSSLALHYIPDLTRLMAQLYGTLVGGGSLVFSMEHPIYTAPSAPQWVVGAEGNKTWPLDHYLDEGPRTTDWLAPGVIKHHRTIATMINLLIRSGFVIAHLDEWAPSAAQIAIEPKWADERQRPPFLIIAATKPSSASGASV